MFRSKDARQFNTPSNQPSLGDRLVHEGKIISDIPAIQSCWKNHIKSLFQSHSESNANLLDIQNGLPRLELLSRMKYDDIVDDDFTVDEVETSIRKLKRNKAGGYDGLSSEHFKFGGPLLTCNSYRGITLTPVLIKIFELTLLNQLHPVLKECGHPLITQTAYQKHISYQDTIFAAQEAILSNFRDGRVCYLSLHDLEKAFDSIKHCILL